MKSLIAISITFILSFFTNHSSAQFIAGDVPAGTSIQYPNIFLADSTIGSPVSDSLDLDCDNIKDVVIDLVFGNNTIDEPHTLWLRVISNTIEVWRDLSNYHNPLPLYSFGDTMCTESFQWWSDSLTMIACGNAFCFDGIHVATDLYFAYRSISTQQPGWIKISFDIYVSYPITASITEVLVLCTGNGIEDVNDEPLFTFAPNPSTDGKINILSGNNISRIEITNAVGQIVKIIPGGQREIFLPENRGLYLIRAMDENGKSRMEKVLRR